ncbi:hypothetical protein [Bradyrhizobium tropiciagri]|nr:hypothetical protein [Bradyrhizobium tropiciagri]
MTRWDDWRWARGDHAKITAGTVAAIVTTGMLFVILYALMIAV